MNELREALLEAALDRLAPIAAELRRSGWPAEVVVKADPFSLLLIIDLEGIRVPIESAPDPVDVPLPEPDSCDCLSFAPGRLIPGAHHLASCPLFRAPEPTPDQGDPTEGFETKSRIFRGPKESEK